MNEYTVRRFRDEDAPALSALIAHTLRTTNSKDYPADYIETAVLQHSPAHIRQRAAWTHFYVVCCGETVVGCGAIGPYWGSETESSLFTIFVLPEHQGKGVGRRIIQTLEQDEYFLRAKRVEIPASITACEFYKKMGYAHKNGVAEIDEERLYRMEKYR